MNHLCLGEYSQVIKFRYNAQAILSNYYKIQSLCLGENSQNNFENAHYIVYRLVRLIY